MRNSLRILLCGFLAGVTWFGLSVFLLSLFAQAFVIWTKTAGSGPHWSGAVDFAIDLAMGVWAVWLYASIVPRYGARPRTAAMTGLAWWVIKTLQSAKWAGLGLIPLPVVPAPLVMTLVAAVGASLVGGWLSDGLGRRSARVS